MSLVLDVFDVICAHAESKTLLSLSRVSSPIHDLTLSHIYSKIHLVRRPQLIGLHNTLVAKPSLRGYVRQLSIRETVIALTFRIPYVYGDIEAVECLSRLIIHLPRLVSLEVENQFLWNLCLADPYFVWAVNSVLARPKSSVTCYQREVRLSETQTLCKDMSRPLLLPVSIRPMRSYEKVDQCRPGCSHCTVQNIVGNCTEWIDFDSKFNSSFPVATTQRTMMPFLIRLLCTYIALLWAFIISPSTKHIS